MTKRLIPPVYEEDEDGELWYPWHDEMEREQECADNDHPPYGVDHRDGNVYCWCGKRNYGSQTVGEVN